MTIQDEGHLAELLEDGIQQGGTQLGAPECELAAKALRWFARMADRRNEQAEEEDEDVLPARETAVALGQRLH